MGRETRRKHSAREKSGALSRREFARHAATAAVAIAALPGSMPLRAAVASPSAANAPELPPPARLPLPQEAAGGHPKLSPDAVAEAEARAAEILRRYGAKLSEEQKADVRRLAREAQVQLDALRAFPLENHDEPATYFRMVSPSSMRRPPTSSAGEAQKPAGKGA